MVDRVLEVHNTSRASFFHDNEPRRRIIVFGWVVVGSDVGEIIHLEMRIENTRLEW